jgi:U3 small nucleolar RNA-associated protein 7
MRDHLEPSLLEFLPYHFLLATASKLGFIKYLDITSGKEIAECKTRKGEATCMKQNQQNAILCSGHVNGEVLMWTPNMASKPVVKILAHLSAPVTSLAVSRCGKYLSTTGKDSRFKIWDIRKNFKCLHDYFTPQPATTCDFSDSGLLSLACGNEV